MTAWTTAMVCVAPLWALITLYEKRDKIAEIDDSARRGGVAFGVATMGAANGALFVFAAYGVACWFGWATP